ncbi:transposase [Methylobacterium sp. E-016]|uniref:transposase n=1 Tax=Methylobacterium sp. E-016 TaxID=2836556 RepID=UPI001FB887CA|nr:transposase [Methylobacterium sp. E-016]MCJ2075987.1 transposase [Methylobacterium sp. E-016]
MYEAASAGAEVKLVDPRDTSQTRSECWSVNAKMLEPRSHACDCGCILDRDVAAARIVLERAFGHGPGHGLRSPSQRVAA